MTRRAHNAGLTLLEMMIVIAIIAMLSALAVGAIRVLRGPNGVETTIELAQVMNRTSQLAVETGKLHRVVLDLDKQMYWVERCDGGPSAMSRAPEALENQFAGSGTGSGTGTGTGADDKRKAAIEAAKQKLSSVPQGALPAGGDDENADEMALALAGDMASLRQCQPAAGLFGDSDGKGGIRGINTNRGAKIKDVWVQHLPDAVASGLVAIYFFPLGSAEKSIIEIGDGEKTFDLLVHGVTGEVEIHDGALSNADDFMMRDATGEKTAP